ncbi:hypothetical protein B0G75_112210 [Paraburkholderia sp. BL18I3N2]|nr:hypothetical protein [Paraburkholderia sp. BL18I3N2]PRX28267.1 hypothetical protein B0G75_112210 [Paraburkholderia sp. BL18I3N2]
MPLGNVLTRLTSAAFDEGIAASCGDSALPDRRMLIERESARG